MISIKYIGLIVGIFLMILICFISIRLTDVYYDKFYVIVAFYIIIQLTLTVLIINFCDNPVLSGNQKIVSVSENAIFMEE